VRRYGDPAADYRNSPVRDLATDLLMRAVVESLRNGDTASELEDRLIWCVRFVENLQLTGRTQGINDAFWTSETERSEKQRQLVERKRHVVWPRYDPRRAYEGDPDNDHYFAPVKRDVAHVVADYISKPWARHPAVDWVLLDMLNTGEMCAFGSYVKDSQFPGGKIIQFALRLVVGWLLPLGFMWWAFSAGHETTGWIALVLFAASTALWLAMLLFRFGLRVYWFATGKPDKTRGSKAIAQAMFETWDIMGSPVVNPAHVRDAMIRARDLGAVWDAPAWAIIDSVMQRDSAVWVTTVQRT
jgi:hypothetical protein